MEKQGKTYNLINSVKGGCGKTTFSIWLAYYLSKRNSGNESGKSAIIDMDLLGTSMLALFFGSNTWEAAKKELGDKKLINEVFRNSESTESYLKEVNFKGFINLNVIFASINFKDKMKFKVGGHSNYSPIIKYSTFRSGLKKLLKQNAELKPIKHIIMDMPPNSDGFSEAAMECVFNKHYQVTEFSDKKNLFFMVGPDYGHTIATINELEEIISKKDEGFPDKIFIVFNNNLCSEVSEVILQQRMGEFRNNLIGLSEDERDSIYFFIMNRNEKFAQAVFNASGLKNLSPDEWIEIFPECPVGKYAPFDNHVFKTITNDEFLNLLCPEEK